MKAFLICAVLCGTVFGQQQISREHPCPDGQRMQGDYDRGYSCVPDAQTVKAETEPNSGVSDGNAALFQAEPPLLYLPSSRVRTSSSALRRWRNYLNPRMSVLVVGHL